MEEKIIIDEVDVSECKYYHYKGCSATGLRCENCTCYYKQLKRLEQENEELKEQFEIETLKNNDTNECVYRSNLLNKYKHALEEIKKLTVIGINASQCNCGLRALADDILQIISEVENER